MRAVAPRTSQGARWAFWQLVVLALALVLPLRVAQAAPQAHILRVDPRASLDQNQPLLTTVIELVQHKPMSEVTAQCAHLTGSANTSCVSGLLERPKALYDGLKFPEKNAFFTVTVDGRDLPAKFHSVDKWGQAKSQPGVGTAWLIMIDASGGMGSRFTEAKTVARAFVDKMGPNDMADIMFFNDRSVVKHLKWTPDKRVAANFVDSVGSTFAIQGRSKQLFNIVKTGVTDAFGALGNVGGPTTIPLHQAMVLLTDGDSGTDPGSIATTALGLRDYLTKGRFPEDNTTLPRTPMPVISVWFPTKNSEEFTQNARQFMENLANPEVGGGFYIVQGGESGKGTRIATAVHTRFDDMYLVRWRVACVAPQVSQDFKLTFPNVTPAVAGDNCLQCPLGVDPTQWPLDIDVAQTQAHAKKNKVYPGGTVKIFGDFCWGSEHERAEIYLIPKNQPAPASLKGKSVEEAKQAQQTLIRAKMKGKSISGGDSYIEFEVPDSEKFLVGKGSKQTARMVVYDTFAKRTSPVLEGQILTLPAEKAPLNLLLIGGATFGGVVLILLIVTLVRSGGSSRQSRAAPRPPAPVVAGAGVPMAPAPGPMPGPPGPAGPMPGAPMPGAAGPPGAPMAGAAMAGAPMAGAPMPGAPMPGAPMAAGPAMGSGYPPAGPAMGSCFPDAGSAPPPAAPAGAATRAMLHGNVGVYPVAGGREVKVGRDPGLCDIHLTEPRISGMHASLKFEGGQLLVRDEGSNNGSYVNGGRIQSYGWIAVPPGATLKFGPIEFTVQLE